MVAFFPEPYPNEDFRSIIHRYHIRSGYLTFKETRNDLFNVRSGKNPYFPKSIRVFINLLNSEKYSLNYFIHKHTIFPTLFPFIGEKRKEMFMSQFFDENYIKKGKSIENYNLDRIIKYCPRCLEADLKKYGEVYIHRFHQYNFLSYCYIHYSDLITSCNTCGISLTTNYNSVLITTPFCQNGHYLAHTENSVVGCSDYIIGIIRDIMYLNTKSNKLTRNLVIDLLLKALGSKGYLNIYSTTIKLQELKEDFIEYVTSKIELFPISIENIVNTNFRMLLSKKNIGANNILTYLLLIRFLSNSIEAFFNDSNTYTIVIPFQNKPQVCINRLCDYYSNSIITTYKKTYYPTYVQGTFKCPHCGLTYGRKWIWANGGKNGFGQNPFVIDQGELWQEKIMELYANGMSIRDIQNSIGTYKEIIAEFLRNKLGEVEYSRRFNPKNNTLYKHIEKGRKGFYDESLKEINMGEQEVAATFSFEKKRLFIRRRNIYNLVQGNPALSRKGIEELARTDYRWLMKNNKEWLNDILPPTKRDK